VTDAPIYQLTFPQPGSGASSKAVRTAARDPDWVGRPFFARFDPKATWIDDLRPPLGEYEFFYESQMRELENARGKEIR
jgi:hypothetical protein